MRLFLMCYFLLLLILINKSLISNSNSCEFNLEFNPKRFLNEF